MLQSIGPRRYTPAVLRAFDVLELVAAAPDGLSAGAIVEESSLPRSTVHELLATLLHRGYLTRGSDQTYRVGVRSFVLASGFTRNLALRDAGLASARRVAERCSETVNIGVLDGDAAIILGMVESTRPVRTISRVGARVPASCTALGKALLAYTGDSELDALSRHLPALTDRSITEPDVFLAQMSEVRREGIAWESGESNDGVSCVGSPIWDGEGAVAGSMSITVPDMRWRERPRAEWAALVAEGADDVTRTLGGVPRRMA